jgi:DNA-binding IclR family transcriptional regulator
MPAGKKAGVTMAEILALPDVLRTMVTTLLRQPEAGLAEIAALIEEDETTTHALLADLITQGFVQEVQHAGEEQLHYRVRLIAKRGRTLPLDL